jgi:hypothetical protein
LERHYPGEVDQKYLKSFEIEKISWTDHARSGDVLHKVQEKRNILHTTKRMKTNWIGHILCRNCLLKHMIEGEKGEGKQMTGRQGTRYKHLLDDLKDTR